VNLEEIVTQLNARKQRATYQAVAGLVGVAPTRLMAGHPKDRKLSWVVAAAGKRPGAPTGYEDKQIHPECLRQIRAGSGAVIKDASTLRRWLDS
jgi:hypothetical protein